MKTVGLKRPDATLETLGFAPQKNIYWNLSPGALSERTVCNGTGQLADSGALVVDTGKYTGRAPKDRFIVADDTTASNIHWGDVNMPFDAARFDRLYEKVIDYLNKRILYVRDAYACANQRYRLNLRVVNELAWQNLFAHNLFLRPSREDILHTDPDWTIIDAPGFKANPKEDGTHDENFVIINFPKKVVLIGGTGYAGEMKKSIFSVLNFMLPYHKDVLSMHCSANIGEQGDTAIFFGLSGTGKTTLSADPNRDLIGDDEHGWGKESIFNFEGGCYAKCIDLTEQKEPQIYQAIRFGTVVENVKFLENSHKIDFADGSKTANTRAAYPLHFIKNAVRPSVGPVPKNIFFLTCDAFGVLPPISRLTPGQAMYHFISGYTAKVAGTEAGITEPKTTFSACFGAPFLPLHPTYYAEMLGKKMRAHKVNVWLVNTGWTGGPYGEGQRMALKHTRALITAALEGVLEEVPMQQDEVFGLAMPKKCPNVPENVLNPRETWKDKARYDRKAQILARAFTDNFTQYSDQASEEIRAAQPRVTANA